MPFPATAMPLPVEVSSVASLSTVPLMRACGSRTVNRGPPVTVRSGGMVSRLMVRFRAAVFPARSRAVNCRRLLPSASGTGMLHVPSGAAVPVAFPPGPLTVTVAFASVRPAVMKGVRLT